MNYSPLIRSNTNEIELNLDIESIDMDVDTIVPLGLIANELISNALKHAFIDEKKGKLSIKLTQEKDQFVFNVSDNGKGMDNLNITSLSNSFGYQMISAFTEQLNAQISVTDNSPGTKVELHNSTLLK